MTKSIVVLPAVPDPQPAGNRPFPPPHYLDCLKKENPQAALRVILDNLIALYWQRVDEMTRQVSSVAKAIDLAASAAYAADQAPGKTKMSMSIQVKSANHHDRYIWWGRRFSRPRKDKDVPEQVMWDKTVKPPKKVSFRCSEDKLLKRFPEEFHAFVSYSESEMALYREEMAQIKATIRSVEALIRVFNEPRDFEVVRIKSETRVKAALSKTRRYRAAPRMHRPGKDGPSALPTPDPEMVERGFGSPDDTASEE